MNGIKLKDFLATFDGLDLEAEVSAGGGVCGDVSIYVNGREAWASDL